MGEVVKDEYQTDYVAGQDNINPFGLDLHNWVFPVAAIIVVLFVIGTLMFPVAAKETLDGAKWDIIASFDWFFLLSANIFVVVSLALVYVLTALICSCLTVSDAASSTHMALLRATVNPTALIITLTATC